MHTKKFDMKYDDYDEEGAVSESEDSFEEEESGEGIQKRAVVTVTLGDLASLNVETKRLLERGFDDPDWIDAEDVINAPSLADSSDVRSLSDFSCDEDGEMVERFQTQPVSIPRGSHPFKTSTIKQMKKTKDVSFGEQEAREQLIREQRASRKKQEKLARIGRKMRDVFGEILPRTVNLKEAEKRLMIEERKSGKMQARLIREKKKQQSEKSLEAGRDVLASLVGVSS